MAELTADRRRSTAVYSDDDALALLGKKQVLKRRFGFISIFGFAMCELITWETVLALFSQGLDNGGPAGLIYGYIIAWLSTLSVYTVIAELASMAPIAGGQYYWVYMLAPPKYRKFCSYIIGWLTSLAWIATVATETIFAGLILQGLLILNYPETYDSKQYQGTLFAWLVVASAIFINAVIPGTLPRLEILILGVHLAGFIAIVATLWATAPHGSATFVWASSLNEGGWPTQGLSYCVGFLGNVATFVGADASVHMAEEIENAALNVPRAITISMLFNGCLGFVMMVTVLYCLGDITSVLESATGFPFLQVFYNSVQSTAGAVAMGAVVLVLTWVCAIGITTTASRMAWSFARDKGVPFSRFISKVDSRTKVPIVALLVVCFFACLLTLIYIGSYTAFNDVVSLTITGFYGSYLMPAAFLLYHRIRGHIAPYGTAPEAQDSPFDMSAGSSKFMEKDHIVGPVDTTLGNKVTTDEKRSEQQTVAPAGQLETAQARLIWGPWHLPAWLGTLNNVYACCYMVFVIFWSVWPPATPVTASTMNYSVVVTGGVIILSIVWYFVRGRKEYQGPLIDEEVARIMRLGSVARIET